MTWQVHGLPYQCVCWCCQLLAYPCDALQAMPGVPPPPPLLNHLSACIARHLAAAAFSPAQLTHLALLAGAADAVPAYLACEAPPVAVAAATLSATQHAPAQSPAHAGAPSGSSSSISSSSSGDQALQLALLLQAVLPGASHVAASAPVRRLGRGRAAEGDVQQQDAPASTPPAATMARGVVLDALQDRSAAAAASMSHHEAVVALCQLLWAEGRQPHAALLREIASGAGRLCRSLEPAEELRLAVALLDVLAGASAGVSVGDGAGQWCDCVGDTRRSHDGALQLLQPVWWQATSQAADVMVDECMRRQRQEQKQVQESCGEQVAAAAGGAAAAPPGAVADDIHLAARYASHLSRWLEPQWETATAAPHRQQVDTPLLYWHVPFLVRLMSAVQPSLATGSAGAALVGPLADVLARSRLKMHLFAHLGGWEEAFMHQVCVVLPQLGPAEAAMVVRAVCVQRWQPSADAMDTLLARLEVGAVRLGQLGGRRGYGRVVAAAGTRRMRAEVLRVRSVSCG